MGFGLLRHPPQRRNNIAIKTRGLELALAIMSQTNSWFGHLLSSLCSLFLVGITALGRTIYQGIAEIFVEDLRRDQESEANKAMTENSRSPEEEESSEGDRERDLPEAENGDQPS